LATHVLGNVDASFVLGRIALAQAISPIATRFYLAWSVV